MYYPAGEYKNMSIKQMVDCQWNISHGALQVALVSYSYVH